jgi:hypothetical protein
MKEPIMMTTHLSMILVLKRIGQTSRRNSFEAPPVEEDCPICMLLLQWQIWLFIKTKTAAGRHYAVAVWSQMEWLAQFVLFAEKGVLASQGENRKNWEMNWNGKCRCDPRPSVSLWSRKWTKMRFEKGSSTVVRMCWAKLKECWFARCKECSL